MLRVALFSLLALASCVHAAHAQLQAQALGKPQTPGFDLGRLFGSRRNDPILSVLDRHLPAVQKVIDTTRRSCLVKLKMPANQRMLLREPRPTQQEKRLIECVLKGIEIMDDNSNRLNLRRVEELTSLVTEDNKLAMALSCSLAQGCNRATNSQKPCEAAHQLNQCIGRQLERNQIKLSW